MESNLIADVIGETTKESVEGFRLIRGKVGRLILVLVANPRICGYRKSRLSFLVSNRRSNLSGVAQQFARDISKEWTTRNELNVSRFCILEGKRCAEYIGRGRDLKRI